MRFPLRAAALAAAAFAVFSAAGFTAPSFAYQAEAQPGVSYIEHAATTLTADNLGLNEIPDADVGPVVTDTPVAVHALAPAFPAAPDALAPPLERGDRSLAELVAELSGTETTNPETDCLARAIYYESKGEPLVGQLSVAEVILNRAESGRFPSTICGVVRQAGQFSFVRRGHIPTPPASSRDWRVAVGVARVAVQDLADGDAPRALFFHARHVRPGWRLTRVATVGNHVFYR